MLVRAGQRSRTHKMHEQESERKRAQEREWLILRSWLSKSVQKKIKKSKKIYRVDQQAGNPEQVAVQIQMWSSSRILSCPREVRSFVLRP